MTYEQAPVQQITDRQVEAALKAAHMHSTVESRKDMRRAIEAAAPQPAQQQETVAWMHEWADGERIPMLMGRDDRNNDKPKTVRPLVYGDTSPQPAQQHARDAVTWTPETGYVFAQPAQQPAQQPAPVQEPVFWYRPVGDDGGYEGPIHNSAIEKVRKMAGTWRPLYTSPQPAPVQQESVAWYESVAELAAVYGEMCAINETKRDDQTPEQTARLAHLRSECVALHKKRIGILAVTPQPAQPVIPDAITDGSESPEYRSGWNECRELTIQMNGKS